MVIWDEFWHRRLGRPYKLKRAVDRGRGAPVVLLHGLGRSSKDWRRVIEGLKNQPFRVLAFDLLGFGRSPKPTWLEYNIDDHASAVIASLESQRLRQPAILVGHSMGCLVALRVARLRPKLTRHLVLYEMPLYEGLPNKRSYRLRQNIYTRLYEWIADYKLGFVPGKMPRIERLARKYIGFEVSSQTWQPFVLSLRNTIMRQTAPDDIKHLKVPMDVIYGRLDMLVIRGKPELIFGKDSAHVKAHTIRAAHVITAKASQFLIERIKAAAQPETPKGPGLV